MTTHLPISTHRNKRLPLLWYCLFLFSILHFPFSTLHAQYVKPGDIIYENDRLTGTTPQGVVFWVDPNGTKGWIVALTDANGGNTYQWSPDPYTGVPPTIATTSNTAIADTAGYANTATIRTALGAGTTYAAQNVDFATGWYLPAAGQLRKLYGALPEVNAALSNLSVPILTVGGYWSSTANTTSNAWIADFNTGYVFNNIVTNNANVRAVRAFNLLGTETESEAVVYAEASSSVANSIVWGNQDINGTVANVEGSGVVSYSCIESGDAANNNINTNPLFVSTAVGSEDYRLVTGSPCIGTGNVADVPAELVNDMYGMPFVVGNKVDMGAFSVSYTVSASANGNGSISPVGDSLVNYDASIAYTITPNTGYHIDSVRVNGINRGLLTDYTFSNVQGDSTIAAYFSINQYTVSASANGNGSISPVGDSLVNYDASIAYTITPNTGYRIDSVLVNGINRGLLTDYTFSNVQGDSTIAAYFSINQFTVSASANGNGSISPSGDSLVNYDASIAYTITPNTGDHIDSVRVNGINRGLLTDYTFSNVQGDSTIAAYFSINQYTVNASANGNGSISPVGDSLVNYDASIAYTITPNTGDHIDSVLVNGINRGTLTDYTFSNVQGDSTIAAYFSINQFTVSASANGNGSISPVGDSLVNYDASIAYAITPTTGYHIDSVRVNGINRGTLTDYTFSNVQGDSTIAAYFSINQYTVNASAIGNGNISPVGDSLVNYDASIAYTITPTTGYHIDSVRVNGINRGLLTDYTFSNVQGDSTIAAYFSINQYTVSASANGNGSISPVGDSLVNYDASIAYTITPNTGYHIDSVRVNGINRGLLTDYTFSNVQGDSTIAAYFSINQYTVSASANGNGSISPVGDSLVNYDASIAYTITPNTGYRIDSVLVNGINRGLLTDYTFSNVQGDSTIAAYFSINQFTVSASANGNGSISPSGDSLVNYDASIAYTITPNTGDHIDSVRVNGINRGLLTDYTFSNVQGDSTIAAYFSINQYTVNASANGNGSISPVGDSLVNYDASIAYTITPNTGDHIDSVLVNGINRGTLTDYTFSNVQGDSTIAAYFSINQFTVSASANGNGSISPVGDSLVNYDASIAYAITPTTGYHIDSVRVNGINRGTLTDYTFSNVQGDSTIAAYFSINQYTVNASAIGNGSISPVGDSLVNYDASIACTITPTTGYHIDSVRVNGINRGTLTDYTFSNVQGDSTIAAYFSINQYTVSASVIGNGSISPSGDSLVNYDESIAYAITPTTGYHIDSVRVNGINRGTLTDYTFSNVQGDSTIAAYFSINQFTVSASAIGNGSISPSGDSLVNYDESIAYTITPTTGYHIDSVRVNGINRGFLTDYTFSNVQGDSTIAAYFSINQYTVSASAIGNGSISPVGDSLVNYDASIAFTITATTGYHIDSVLVNGINRGFLTDYTFSNVQGDSTIAAYFSINQYTVSASAIGNGSISPVGDSLVNYDASIAFTITATTGYHIDSVLVNGINRGLLTDYTFSNVQGDSTIAAYFSINQYTVSASAIGNGSISPMGDSLVNYDESIAYTITATTGYHIDSVLVNGINRGLLTDYTFSNVQGDSTIAAYFSINQYTVSASANGNGNISPVGDSLVNYDASIAYTITATTGYHIDSVLVNGINRGLLTDYTFSNVQGDSTIAAYFSINQYTVSASANGNGNISPVGDSLVNYDASIAYTITPTTGYHIDSVLVNGINRGLLTDYIFSNVQGDSTIAAYFSINQFTVSASANGNGSISPVGDSLVNYDASIAFTITATTGYHIDSVLVNGINRGLLTDYTFSNVQGDSTIAAYFSINQYTVSASAIGNGSISPVGDSLVNYDASIAFTITATTGYHIDSVLVNGINRGLLTDYTFSNVQGDSTIAAYFSINQYTVSASAIGNGSISPVGDSLVNYDASIAFTITPNTGYHTDSVLVNGINRGLLTDYTFSNVQGDSTIAAYFSINQYTVNASAIGNGSISPSGDSLVNYDASIAYTITPNTGYHIDSVRVNGINRGLLTDYTFSNVQGDSTIAAYFSINQYTVNASAIGNGSISPVGDSLVNYDASIAYTITATTGYHIDSVLVNGINRGLLTDYTFSNVQGDSTIAAYFSIDQYTVSASANGNGSISPVGDSLVNYDASIAYTITPNTGYRIDSVLVNGINRGLLTDYTFSNVQGDSTIAAYFSIDQYTVSASAIGNGSISPVGDSLVNYDASIAYTITPNTGYRIDSVLVNGINRGLLTDYTFSNVQGDSTIAAYFSIDQYTVSASAIGNGSISPVGDSLVNYDASIAYTITPNTGYHIDSVLVNGINRGLLTDYTFSNVQGDSTIAAYFSINQFTVSASAIGNGNISPVGDSLVNYDASIAYTITPTTGYHIDSVLVNGINRGTLTDYTFSNVQGDSTIAAYFSINQFTVSASAIGNGSISPVGDSLVNYDASIAYTITPTTGYHIDSVLVNGINRGLLTDYTFSNVQGDSTIAAYFSIDQYTVNASANGNGSISPLGDSLVDYDASITYTITPNTGYRVDSVLVDGVNNATAVTAKSYTFSNVIAAHTIRAVFRIVKYTLTASAGTGGSISPNGTVQVDSNANQTFTITPNTGYSIIDVLVNNVSVGAVSTYTFINVRGDSTIAAYFSINQYTVSASAIGNGSISPMGDSLVNYDESIAYTITPTTGYHIDSVRINGINRGLLTDYTFSNVQGDSTIAAYFSINQFTVSASAIGNGSISPSGDSLVNYDESIAYTITPNTGYRIESVLVNGINRGLLTDYTFSNVQGDSTIAAYFSINQYTVSASAIGNGSISPMGDSLVNYDESISYTITPTTGYHIDSVLVDGINNTTAVTNGSYTFSNVTADHSIRAVFRIVKYDITASAGTGGSISPNGTVQVDSNANQTFTITPNTGYSIIDVLVNNVSVGAVSTYTFINVRGDSTISVTFGSTSSNLASLEISQGTLNPTFNPDVTDYEIMMPCDESSITITYGTVSPTATVTIDGISYSSTESVTIPLDKPGVKTVTMVITTSSESKTYTLNITKPFDGNSLLMAWDDVITVVNNSENNGGYTFTAYQWYKNGVAMDGQTRGNLYLPNAADRSEENVYTVTLTTSEGIQAVSCPFMFSTASKKKASLEVYPNPTQNILTVVYGEFDFSTKSETTAEVYSLKGELMGTYILPEPSTTITLTNLANGTYLLKVNGQIIKFIKQ